MKDYEYNWATAEIIKMYLKNSRAQDARKARTVTEVSINTQDALTEASIDTQDALTAGPSGLATADNSAGTSRSDADLDSDSSDDD